MKRFIQMASGFSVNHLKAFFIILLLSFLVFACGTTKEIQKKPHFRFVDATLSKSIDASGTVAIPIEPTTKFSANDREVNALLEFKDLYGKHLLKWDWYDPKDDLYYSTGNTPIEASRGSFLRKATAWHKLSIRGDRAENYLGKWKVKIYVDKEYKKTKYFTIVSPEIDVDENIPRTAMINSDAIALIIGNRNYDHPDIPAVEFALHDAEIMQQYLIKTLGYKNGNIIFETDVAKSKFEALLGITGNHRGTLYDYIKPGKSDVFVYYSGHGAPDPNSRKGYFVPVDCDPAKISLNGYSLDTFYENLSKLEAKSITVVIDACFSGGTSSGSMLIANASPVGIEVDNPAIAYKNTVILTSSKGNQISSWYNEKKHGLFTYFFLKAIRGSADVNRDKRVTFQEIYDFVSDRAEGVPYLAKRLYGGRIQTPDLQGTNKNKVLVRLLEKY